MFILVLAIVLFSVSLLSVFSAPTYRLWLLAIAVTEFSWLFALFAVLLIVVAVSTDVYVLPVAVIGTIAFLLLCKPVIQAWLLAANLKRHFAAAFGPRSTFLYGDNTQQPFSLLKIFKGLGRTMVAHKSMPYATVGGQILALDFYPAQLSGRRPCIVVVHGGSWSSGDSKQLPQLNSHLATLGYNVAAINYRLAPQHQSPAPVNDLEAAFNYLRDNAEELNIDINNLVCLGRSAGAQVAMLAAYSKNISGLKGLINFYGPADMVWGYAKPASKLVMDSRAVMERYLGGGYHQVPQAYANSSPIEFVGPKAVPTLIIHGDNDVLVSPGHATRLNEKLTAEGIRHFYLRLPWATHGFDYTLNGPGGQLSTYVVDRFVNQVCNYNC
ncbi:alpha/beta hydrolase [Mucilaginibacter pallidiroseus]|uniref:Alpha/beta hydrolase n=1 Tax=Mucilaginibacter pallidiroseus TaxID=2599295 RepID=A0A563UEI8_9SPHI|nr:alpha/beta hydrolase [Mucilaginibacter pallidiroseus]TWR29770.1 alpha/beta hydrolase [Mucilaginibacter pallidiroseus]